MNEVHENSFAENKRKGLVWKGNNGNYHPAVTEVKCANCGRWGDVESMIAHEDFFFCDAHCIAEFNGEIE